jgi:hypothetical protein
MHPRGTSPESVPGHSSGRETQDDPYSPDSGINGPTVGRNVSRGLGSDGEDFTDLLGAILQSQGRTKGERAMIRRFCCYIDKVFDFGDRVRLLRDKRQRPRIPTSAIWTSAFTMFAMHHGSLNAIESELRIPKRLDGLVGSAKPSADRIGDVFCLIPPEDLRAMLSGINHQLGRNKVFNKAAPWRFAALDGHEFFSQS